MGYTIDDLKGIQPFVCMHHILMEDDHKPSIENQRRLNPNMKEVVKKKFLKILKARIIYPISNNKWVSLVRGVPNQGGVTVVKNESNKIIPRMTVTD